MGYDPARLMKVAGVDGCRKGWLMVKWDGNSYGYSVYDNFSGLAESQPDLSLLLIDIPIGYPARNFPEAWSLRFEMN